LSVERLAFVIEIIGILACGFLTVGLIKLIIAIAYSQKKRKEGDMQSAIMICKEQHEEILHQALKAQREEITKEVEAEFSNLLQFMIEAGQKSALVSPEHDELMERLLEGATYGVRAAMVKVLRRIRSCENKEGGE